MFKDRKYTEILKMMYSSSLLVLLFNFLTHIIIARILDPEQVGLYSIILIVQSILLMFIDFGISSRIIQNSKLTSKDLNSYYGFTLVIGLSVSFLFWGGIIYYDYCFFLDKEWYSLPFLLLIDVLIIVPLANAKRELYFKQLSLLYIISTIILFITSTTLVIIFESIIGPLIGILLSKIATLFLLRRFKRFQLNFNTILISYSKNKKELRKIFGGESLNLLSAKIDDIFVSLYFGNKIFGHYSIAWNLMLIPVVKINSVINEVSFPYYKTITDKQKLLSHYLQNLLFCMLIGVPLLLLLILNADQLVSFLYGQKWEDLTEYIEIMSFIGITKLINNPGGALLLALEKNNDVLTWNLCWFISVLFLFALGPHWFDDILKLLQLFFVFSCLSVLLFQYIVLKNFEIRTKHFGKHFLFIIICIVTYLLTKNFDYSSFQNIYGILLTTTTFFVIFLFLLVPINHRWKILA